MPLANTIAAEVAEIAVRKLLNVHPGLWVDRENSDRNGTYLELEGADQSTLRVKKRILARHLPAGTKIEVPVGLLLDGEDVDENDGIHDQLDKIVRALPFNLVPGKLEDLKDVIVAEVSKPEDVDHVMVYCQLVLGTVYSSAFVQGECQLCQLLPEADLAEVRLAVPPTTPARGFQFI